MESLTKNQRRNVVKEYTTVFLKKVIEDYRTGCKGLVSANTMQTPANIMSSLRVFARDKSCELAVDVVLIEDKIMLASPCITLTGAGGVNFDFHDICWYFYSVPQSQCT